MAEIVLTTDSTAGNKHVPQLDGLRGIAILLVLVCHVWGNLGTPHFSFLGLDFTALANMGKSGVQLFFVLSGYLLNFSAKNYVRKGDIFTYFKKRTFRILPPYYIAIIFAYALTPGRFWTQSHFLSTDFWLHIFVLHTLFASTLGSINGVFWSLGPEIQFYLMLPPLIIGLTSLEKKFGFRSIVSVLVACSLSEVAIRAILGMFNISNPSMDVLSHNLPLLIASFSIGMLASELEPLFVRSHWVQNHKSGMRSIDLFVIALYVLVTILVYKNEWDPHFTYITSIANNFLISLVYGLTILCALGTDSIISRVASFKVLEKIGLFSFGLFLFHLPILESSWFQIHMQGFIAGKQFFYCFTALLLVALIPAALSYYFVERPCIRYAGKR